MPDALPQMVLTCAECHDPIDCCEACDDEACRVAMCLSCVREVMGEAVPQPHAHGG